MPQLQSLHAPEPASYSERSRCSKINKIEKKRIHLTLQCRGHGFESWSGGRTPHASGQLRLLISPRARVSATRDTSPLERGRGRMRRWCPPASVFGVYFNWPQACVKLEASPQAKASKSANKPLWQEVWALFSWPPLLCSLVLVSSPSSPLRTVCAAAMQGLRNKPRGLLKRAVWGACLSGPGLNSWECLMWGSSPSLRGEKLWILSFLLPVGRHAGRGFITR